MGWAFIIEFIPGRQRGVKLTICLFAHSGVQHILCEFLFCFSFLRLVYPMLPGSLDCPFFDCPFIITWIVLFFIAPSVLSGLSFFYCPFGIIWIVLFFIAPSVLSGLSFSLLPLHYYLDCPFFIAPSVLSGLSLF